MANGKVLSSKIFGERKSKWIFTKAVITFRNPIDALLISLANLFLNWTVIKSPV